MESKKSRLVEVTQAPVTLALFFVAAIAEIWGGYLMWLWLREKKTIALGALGGIILFVYGLIPTLQPAQFGRVYAAYGGIFIVSAITWGRIVDKKKPDRYEIIGSMVAVVGALVIFLCATLKKLYFISKCIVRDMEIRCADCGCFPSECKASPSSRECPNCTWQECCCSWISMQH